MNSKIILMIIGTLGVLAVLVWLGSYQVPTASTSVSPSQGAPVVSASRLTAAETQYDFGIVSMAKGNVTHRYTVTNTSDQPVTLSRLYTSCMCTEAKLWLNGQQLGPFGMPGHGMMQTIDQVLAPGESAAVEAIFNPAAHGPAGVGRVDRIVYVETTDGGKLQLRFTANVTP